MILIVKRQKQYDCQSSIFLIALWQHSWCSIQNNFEMFDRESPLIWLYNKYIHAHVTLSEFLHDVELALDSGIQLTNKHDVTCHWSFTDVSISIFLLFVTRAFGVRVT